MVFKQKSLLFSRLFCCFLWFGFRLWFFFSFFLFIGFSFGFFSRFFFSFFFLLRFWFRLCFGSFLFRFRFFRFFGSFFRFRRSSVKIQEFFNDVVPVRNLLDIRHVNAIAVVVRQNVFHEAG